MKALFMPVHKHRTRDETRAAILALFRDNHTALTRTEIADALRRSKSPFLIEIIEELVAEGLLQSRTFTYHNRVQGFVYSSPQTARR